MENKKKQGFIPLQQLQKRAKQQQKTNNTVIDNPKLVNQKKIYTKYEITPQSYFYVKFGIKFIDEQQQRLVISDYDKTNKEVQCHWLKFRVWTYEECNKIKDACCQLDQNRYYIYNKPKLFKMMVKYLLLDWSFKQNDMKLMHINKVLSDESINLFMNLHPNILFHIEEKIKLVLEENQ